MDPSFYLIQLLNGVQFGFLLFLVASGLTLIFGIMGVINLAHGSFYMVGAYLCYWFAQATGSFVAALAVSVPIVLAIGYAVERLFIARLYHRDHLYQVLLTFGLILIFNDLQSIVFGNDVHGVAKPPPLAHSIPLSANQDYPTYSLFISAVCLALAGAMYWIIQRTRLGMTIRAGASNREMVQVLGINIQQLFAIVFSMGAVLAAFSGMIAAPERSVYPGMGEQVLIMCFVVVVIGGVGSIKGAFVGAMLIGLVNTFSIVFIPDFAGITVYALMAAVLLWRPQGLFGQAGAH